MQTGSRRALIWFLIMLLSGGAAGLLGYNIVTSATAGVPVVVATKAVLPLEPIPEDAVAVVTKPAKGLPEDAVKDPSQVVGKYTRTGLVPGMVVQQAMIAGTPAEGLAGIDAKLTELSKQMGKPLRAYSLELNSAQGYRIIQPNQRVDIIAHIESGHITQAGVLIPNVTVLAKIDKENPSSGGGGGGLVGGNKDEKQQSAPDGVVILAVTPEDAARLRMAQDLGTLSLAPRPVDDEQITAVPLIQDMDLLKPIQPQPQQNPAQANQGAQVNQEAQGQK